MKRRKSITIPDDSVHKEFLSIMHLVKKRIQDMDKRYLQNEDFFREIVNPTLREKFNIPMAAYPNNSTIFGKGILKYDRGDTSITLQLGKHKGCRIVKKKELDLNSIIKEFGSIKAFNKYMLSLITEDQMNKLHMKDEANRDANNIRKILKMVEDVK